MSGKSMKLSFKGDKKKSHKKRERDSGDEGGPSSSRKRKEIDNTDPGVWVFPEAGNEITGPTFVWAPTEPPSCISFDSVKSRVIPATLPPPTTYSESVSPALAYEPNDLHQVWVVSKLSGAETISFRTAGGFFLACDKHGVITANSEARGPLECFTPHFVDGGLVAFETNHSTFLSMDEVAGGAITLRGDATSIGFCESFRVKVQHGFRKKARDELENGLDGKRQNRVEGDKYGLDEVGKNHEAQTWGGGKSIISKESKRELKRAREEGRLAEAMLDRRAKLKSDRMCK